MRATFIFLSQNKINIQIIMICENACAIPFFFWPFGTHNPGSPVGMHSIYGYRNYFEGRPVIAQQGYNPITGQPNGVQERIPPVSVPVPAMMYYNNAISNNLMFAPPTGNAYAAPIGSIQPQYYSYYYQNRLV